MPKTKKQEAAAVAEISPAITKKIEEKQVQERVAIGAHVVHETIRREGEEELKRTVSALAWSGLAAGLSMGFSLVAEALIAGYLPSGRLDALADEAWIQRGISDRGARAAATFYGDDFDGGASGADWAKLANGDADDSAMGSGAAGESGGDVPVCVVRGTGAYFFAAGAADADSGE